jgi:MarR family transcriptional regulator for hemolysin
MTHIENSPEAIAQQLMEVMMCSMKSSQSPMVQLTNKFDLTLSQLKIMFIIDDADHPLALHEIASATMLSLPAAGRAVDALHRSKLVSRTEDENDRRVKRVALTEVGQDAADQISEARLNALGKLFVDLTEEERTAFAEALAPVHQNLPQRLAALEDSPHANDIEMEAAR